jgi:hypothetical protein
MRSQASCCGSWGYPPEPPPSSRCATQVPPRPTAEDRPDVDSSALTCANARTGTTYRSCDQSLSKFRSQPCAQGGPHQRAHSAKHADKQSPVSFAAL